MVDHLTEPASEETQAPKATAALIGGAGLLALLTASCCVLPIGLSLIGLGGSWLVLLGPFVAWRVPILIGVAAVLAHGWWRHLRRPACARPARLARGLLLGATALFLLSLAAPLWEEEATRFMFSLWREART
ncbi:MerT mercuric transport protein [Pseudoruegeria aquimaris]|uniref:MerT mercuric transport protein n=1 Tax=Pseudoruegeria aquimaris TaxID=393663 RepID=A0A1Y5TJJ9_9RHOB|nr:hypothetical protein [Pseudoruegeria aquimaris]SLN63444.1 MerT mercuric transport protein [Pseudoruegeria aquimaris]